MSDQRTIKTPERKYLPKDFKITTWVELKQYFDLLTTREISSLEMLRRWFQDRSELESVISEDFAWRYIKMTCFTEDKAYRESYQYFVEQIQPEIAPYSDALNKKCVESQFIDQLSKFPGYDLLVRNIKNEIEIFRDKNIPLFTDITTEAQKYGQLIGAMVVEIDGKTMTMPQAGVLLMDLDREMRENVYRQISERRLVDRQELDLLFSKLVTLRQQIAENAGFANFRDYKFKALARFDYTPDDCFKFHQAISTRVVPLLNFFASNRQKKLGLSELRPWDKIVDLEGREALKAFTDGQDLTTKGIEVFKRIDPFLGECLGTMREIGHLDLESRPGKAPGGYNYPLAEIGVPFIFMNATSTLRDLVTFMHEGGHAIHSFVTKDLELQDFKSTPSEVAELASMAMELISMDHWDVFFKDQETLKRAKREHLESLIDTLPWVALIDKYQHWIYENPNHSLIERKQNWERILSEFSDTITNWDGLADQKNYLWQKQLHLYEVPFYYIEYGMAQLGAIAVWRNYKVDKKSGLAAYLKALSLGQLQSIPQIYQAAGIKFDFSETYIGELMDFLKVELEKLGD